MNYYYEIPEGGTVFGKPPGYYYYANCSPAQGGFMNHMVHSAIMKHSTRVWLENANGVTLVKAPEGDKSFGHVDPKEFVMIKLKSRDFNG